MEPSQTIGQMLRQLQDLPKNHKALVSFTERGWVSLSSEDMFAEIKWLALALISMGVKKGDLIGIIALPSARWTLADLAIMAIGAVSVPLFANISEENFLHQIKQTHIKILFVSGEEQWKRCLHFRHLFSTLLSLDYEYPPLESYSYVQLLHEGKKYEEEHPQAFETTSHEVQPEDLATIIYTSGSTGLPKGAEHTHHSITALLDSPIFSWDRAKDRYLSFLPLAHVFARSLNLILFSWGVPIYYYNDIKNLGLAFEEVHPTLMIVVPRLLEKLYAKMALKIENEQGLKYKLGNWALHLAQKDLTHFWDKCLRLIADKLLYRKLRHSLGGCLRVVISGGAPLNPQLYRFFLNAGIPLYEGWGLTESCPVSVNREGKIKVGTVGPPLDRMEVTIGKENELLIKGPMMMRGYYQSPEMTLQTFNKEGWLRTGDKGVMDDEGYITIIGRLKELVKTSTGEMIAPIPIELSLCKNKLIDQALIIAEGRKSVSCLLVPDFDALKNWKKKNGLEYLEDQEVFKNALFKGEIEEGITRINEHLNHWEKVRDYRIIPHPLSIENGELTPSMKVRRDAVEKKYKDLIESMYRHD